jgi:hypothetical protein
MSSATPGRPILSGWSMIVSTAKLKPHAPARDLLPPKFRFVGPRETASGRSRPLESRRRPAILRPIASRPVGGCALLSGHAVASRQRRHPAMSGHIRTAARLPVTGHSKIDASICTITNPAGAGPVLANESITACADARLPDRRGRGRRVRACRVREPDSRLTTRARYEESRYLDPAGRLAIGGIA